MKKYLVCFLAFLILLCCSAAAEETAGEEYAEIAGTVRALAWPYYKAAIEVARSSPDYGRDFTDHKTAHADMVAVKSVEAAEAVAEGVRRGTLGASQEEGRVALSADIDYPALIGAALFHDTGMCGSGYALTEATDEDGSSLLDENGRQKYVRDGENGLYAMHAEDNLNFFEVRTYHSLNSALYVLVNRDGLREAGYRDAQIDLMAAACMAHSKSSSGVRDLNSRADWAECFDRIDACVAAWNADHPEEGISFDRTVFESDDSLLSVLATETLALRVGDVSRDSGPDAEVQTGEKVHVDRSTLNDRGGTVGAELEGAVITIGVDNDDVPGLKGRQVHAGEQNIVENHTYVDDSGLVVHEITIADGCSAPRCTQESVNDHLGEFCSARDERFTVRIVFLSFEDGSDGYFRDAWEDYRVQADQDYPTVEIQYPWDEEVSE